MRDRGMAFFVCSKGPTGTFRVHLVTHQSAYAKMFRERELLKLLDEADEDPTSTETFIIKTAYDVVWPAGLASNSSS